MTSPPDPATRPRATRRDAQARREALITAATACFATQGYGVPLEIVADRAGVGRGTLYRNFKDREALALAIFSREVDRLEAAIDPHLPLADTLAMMVREGAAASALFWRIVAELPREDRGNLAAFTAIGDRLERVLIPAVDQAHARGEIDRRITPRDMVLAMRMAGGLLRPHMDEAEAAAQVSGAVRLLFDGLRPR